VNSWYPGNRTAFALTSETFLFKDVSIGDRTTGQTSSDIREVTWDFFFTDQRECYLTAYDIPSAGVSITSVVFTLALITVNNSVDVTGSTSVVEWFLECTQDLINWVPVTSGTFASPPSWAAAQVKYYDVSIPKSTIGVSNTYIASRLIVRFKWSGQTKEGADSKNEIGVSIYLSDFRVNMGVGVSGTGKITVSTEWGLLSPDGNTGWSIPRFRNSGDVPVLVSVKDTQPTLSTEVGVLLLPGKSWEKDTIGTQVSGLPVLNYWVRPVVYGAVASVSFDFTAGSAPGTWLITYAGTNTNEAGPGISFGTRFTITAPLTITRAGSYLPNGTTPNAGFNANVRLANNTALTTYLIDETINTTAGVSDTTNRILYKVLSAPVVIPAGTYTVWSSGFNTVATGFHRTGVGANCVFNTLSGGVSINSTPYFGTSPLAPTGPAGLDDYHMGTLFAYF